MSIIIVNSQKELDMIPYDTEDIIKIRFGTDAAKAIVRKCYRYPVKAYGNSSVIAYENSSVIAYENSSVTAYGNSSVEAWDNSSVRAYENSSVIAYENSSVIAYGNVQVKAYGNSSVKAWDNSSVRAYENSSVIAYENSSVIAYGNVQVIDFSEGAIINIFENARTVFMPRNINEFMNFYRIKNDETTAIFYKAVHKKNSDTLSEYVSDYDEEFKYKIGKKVTSNGFDNNPEKPCGKGIHISHKRLALNYGRHWEDLAILEVKVKIKDILLPKHSDGKVRAPEVEVIREVPFEEWRSI